MVIMIVGVAAILLVVGAASSVRFVKDDHRLIVLRLGRLTDVVGPGVAFILPIVDHTVDVALDEKVPEWRALSPEDLRKRLFTWYSETPGA